MRRFHGQCFARFFDQDSGAVFEDFEFERCTFSHCALSITEDVRKRSTIRRIKMFECECRNSGWLWPLVAEDVVVRNLRAHDDCRAFGAVYKHVVLEGAFRHTIIIDNAPWLGADPLRILRTKATIADIRDSFLTANARYYEGVDWALDLSMAEFSDLCLRGIPARLIRRNAERQIVVTQESAERSTAWEQLECNDSTVWIVMAIRGMLEEFPEQGLVLVAGTLSERRRRTDIEAFEFLRREGVAEPE